MFSRCAPAQRHRIYGVQYESSVATGQWTLGSNRLYERRGYFFDSFGRPPSYFGFEEFMNENCATWMYNDAELQSPLSNACGYHVIAFWLSRINNMSQYDYISMFSDNLTLNDFFGDEMVRISSAFILMCQFNKLVLK